MPSVAINSADRPKNVITIELSRSSWSVPLFTSFIVATSVMASIGLICRIVRRTAGTNCAVGRPDRTMTFIGLAPTTAAEK